MKGLGGRGEDKQECTDQPNCTAELYVKYKWTKDELSVIELSTFIIT